MKTDSLAQRLITQPLRSLTEGKGVKSTQTAPLKRTLPVALPKYTRPSLHRFARSRVFEDEADGHRSNSSSLVLCQTPQLMCKFKEERPHLHFYAHVCEQKQKFRSQLFLPRYDEQLLPRKHFCITFTTSFRSTVGKWNRARLREAGRIANIGYGH